MNPDVCTAIRHLMVNPTVLVDRAEDREIHGLIRRNASQISRWFAQHPGYDLRVEAEWARLVKTPIAGPGSVNGERTHGNRPFNRERYVWLCLALAAIDRLEQRRTRLGVLAEEIEAIAAQEGVRIPNLDHQPDRAALVDVLRVLEREGVVRLMDGQASDFVDDSGDALYDVNIALAARMLAAPRAPSFCSVPDELGTEMLPSGADGERTRISQQVWRRLLEQPVIYYETLTEGELAWLDRSRAAVARELTSACGLTLEVKAEGVAAVEPDVGIGAFPGTLQGTRAVAIATVHRVLVAKDVEAPGYSVPVVILEAAMAPLLANPRASRDYVADGGVRLLDQALDALERAGLIERGLTDVRPLPALRRYAFFVDDLEREPTS